MNRERGMVYIVDQKRAGRTGEWRKRIVYIVDQKRAGRTSE